MLVILVTPSLSPDCLAVLRGLVAIAGARVGLVCHAAADGIPSPLREQLVGHYKVDSVGDEGAVLQALLAFQASFGRIHRLLGFAEVLQVQLARLRDRLGIEGLTEAVALNFRDKHRMKEALARAGLPVARQQLVQAPSAAWAFAEAVGWPVVLKPLAGVGSQGTMRADGPRQLEDALTKLRPSPERPVLAEAFLRGPERTFETVLVDGQPVWCSQTLYLDRPLDILETPWKQWTVLFPREVMDDEARRFLATDVAALRALGLRTGMAHLEWFLTPDGPVIGEVGARPPGARFMTMLGYSYDADLWARWAELEVLGVWRPLPERQHAVGCAFFRGQGHGSRIVAVEGLDRAQRAVGSLVMDVQLPQIGAAARPSYEGDGWAVVRHPDTEVVRDALRTLISSVRVRLG